MDINIFIFLLFALLIYSSSHFISYYTLTLTQNEQKTLIYQMWKKQYSMTFSYLENQYRFKIFLQNLDKIQSHNSKLNQTYKLGLNQFAHLNEDQFSLFFLRNIQFDTYNIKLQKIQKNLLKIGNLSDIDWQIIGKVSQIKNQGSCNAGYAFSTTSLVQSSLMMQNQNILLSEQHIIDCALDYQTLGCNGGSRAGAIRFAQQKGLASQSQYPYNGTKGICKNPTGKYKADFTMLQSNGCDQIKDNLYVSPLTVAVNARNWQLYSTGIFSNCPTTVEVNHEAMLVGSTVNYWRLKNSWGTRWGQNGYIRIKLGNNCGICQRPAYGFVF